MSITKRGVDRLFCFAKQLKNRLARFLGENRAKDFSEFASYTIVGEIDDRNVPLEKAVFFG